MLQQHIRIEEEGVETEFEENVIFDNDKN